jgi:hypothetical protein
MKTVLIIDLRHLPHLSLPDVMMQPPSAKSTSIGERRYASGLTRVRFIDLIIHSQSHMSSLSTFALRHGYTVVDHFDLNREVVSIAMNNLDRFLDTFTGEVDKNLFQLLAMTCLYLSIKLNEYKHLLIPESTSSMDTILRLSRGAFTLQQMERMEYEVLQRLRWHVHPPTPQLFVKHFLFFLSVEEHEVHDLTQFMIELSVMDYFFVSYKPSEVAIASLLNALQLLYPQRLSLMNLSFLSNFVDLQSPAIVACRERLSLIYAQANDPSPESSLAKDTSFSSASEPSTLHRTTSPVSVMAAPQPYDSSYSRGSQYQQERIMETDYVVVEDDFDDL